MKFGEAASAYGMFQVVFADIVCRVAVYTLLLRREQEPALDFNTVFRQDFKHLLNDFKRQLRRFDDGDPQLRLVLEEIRDACATASRLSKWRNDRVHARVLWSEDGYRLYDWRTGAPLQITSEQAEQMIQEGVGVIAALETSVPELGRLRSANSWVEKELAEIFAGQGESEE